MGLIQSPNVKIAAIMVLTALLVGLGTYGILTWYTDETLVPRELTNCTYLKPMETLYADNSMDANSTSSLNATLSVLTANLTQTCLSIGPQGFVKVQPMALYQPAENISQLIVSSYCSYIITVNGTFTGNQTYETRNETITINCDKKETGYEIPKF